MTQTELAGLHDELAGVAKNIARLLLRPGHDPAELAELDKRAAELRARIRALEAQAAMRVVELRFPGNNGGRMAPEF